jgi:hypothetical protein
MCRTGHLQCRDDPREIAPLVGILEVRCVLAGYSGLDKGVPHVCVIAHACRPYAAARRNSRRARSVVPPIDTQEVRISQRRIEALLTDRAAVAQLPCRRVIGLLAPR